MAVPKVFFGSEYRLLTMTTFFWKSCICIIYVTYGIIYKNQFSKKTFRFNSKSKNKRSIYLHKNCVKTCFVSFRPSSASSAVSGGKSTHPFFPVVRRSSVETSLNQYNTWKSNNFLAVGVCFSSLLYSDNTNVHDSQYFLPLGLQRDLIGSSFYQTFSTTCFPLTIF